MDTNIKEKIEYPKEGILSKEIVKTEKVDATLFCMASNAGMSEHTSTKEGLIYVIEGDGIFRLEGKDIKMHEGVIIHIQKNAVHALKAKKNTSFLLVLFK